MSSPAISLKIGDRVVYPNHGVGIVEQIISRSNGDFVEKFYMLKIAASSLRVSIPSHSVGNVGLRPVVKNGQINKILEFLATGKCNTHPDWKERYKENCDKMRTGTLIEVAEVMKALLILNQDKPLSFREKKMLERAKYLLVSELALAKNVTEGDSEELISKHLLKNKLRFPDLTADA